MTLVFQLNTAIRRVIKSPDRVFISKRWAMRMYLNYKRGMKEFGGRGQTPNPTRSLAEGGGARRGRLTVRGSVPGLPAGRFPVVPTARTSNPLPRGPTTAGPPNAFSRQPQWARLRLRPTSHRAARVLGVVPSQLLPHARRKALGSARRVLSGAALPLTCPRGRLSSLLIGSFTKVLPFLIGGKTYARARTPVEGAKVRVSMAAADARRPGAEGPGRAFNRPLSATLCLTALAPTAAAPPTATCRLPWGLPVLHWTWWADPGLGMPGVLLPALASPRPGPWGGPASPSDRCCPVAASEVEGPGPCCGSCGCVHLIC